MKSQLHSLLYKKYSLLPIQVYLLFQLVFVIIISLLRYLKFEVNEDSITFNSSVLLTIISFSFFREWSFKCKCRIEDTKL